MSQLVTAAQVKEYLDITGTDQDALINSLITRLSAFAETFCNRIFDDDDYTEIQDGQSFSDNQLFTKQFPINTLASVHDDKERVYGASTLIPAADLVFEADEGIIKRTDGGVFAEGVHNIQIIYNAGFVDIPDDLQQAVIELVGLKLSGRGRENLKSERLGRFAVTYMTHPTLGQIAVTDSIQLTLNKYRKQDFRIV